MELPDTRSPGVHKQRRLFPQRRLLSLLSNTAKRNVKSTIFNTVTDIYFQAQYTRSLVYRMCFV